MNKQFCVKVNGGICTIVAKSESEAKNFVLENVITGTKILSLKEMNLSLRARRDAEEGRITPFVAEVMGFDGDRIRWRN